MPLRSRYKYCWNKWLLKQRTLHPTRVAIPFSCLSYEITISEEGLHFICKEIPLSVSPNWMSDALFDVLWDYTGLLYLLMFSTRNKFSTSLRFPQNTICYFVYGIEKQADVDVLFQTLCLMLYIFIASATNNTYLEKYKL